MGQYKVPQNVEAEDHILGPLTFKQFTYAMIGFGWAAICFGLFHAVPALLVIIGFPPTLLLLLLAFYNRDGQNFEQLLLAMVEFFAASRKRLWLKEDVAETFFVKPTPAVIEATQRDPNEVLSELEKVARLIDSRGWNVPAAPENAQFQPSTKQADRIVAPPAAAAATDEPGADMLDLTNSPLAQNLAQLLQDAAKDVRAEAVAQMAQKPAPKPAARPTSPSISGVTSTQPGDILKLAQESGDISVSQLAAQATRLAPPAGGQTVDLPANGS